MILSNRKLKLIIISLLLLIFSYFLGLFKVNALTTSGLLNPNHYPSNFSSLSQQIDIKTLNNVDYVFNGYGEGYVIFSYVYDNNGGSGATSPIFEVYVQDGLNNIFSCELGNQKWYVNNSEQFEINTLKCPVNLVGTSLRKIYFHRRGTAGSTSVMVGEYITFVGKDSTNVTVNNSEVTSAINSSSAVTNQILVDNQQIQNDIKSSVNDVKDTIKDSSIDNNQATSSASTWNSKNATNGVITQLLTLPISLLQAIVNGIQTTCSSFSLGSLFGTNITLPCINISSLIGSGLFTTIDILFSGFMILSISKKMIKIFNDFTNLKSNQIDELYGGGSN